MHASFNSFSEYTSPDKGKGVPILSGYGRKICDGSAEKIGKIDTEWQTYLGSSNVFSQFSFLSLLEILPKLHTVSGVAMKRCLPEQHRLGY